MAFDPGKRSRLYGPDVPLTTTSHVLTKLDYSIKLQTKTLSLDNVDNRYNLGDARIKCNEIAIDFSAEAAFAMWRSMDGMSSMMCDRKEL